MGHSPALPTEGHTRPAQPAEGEAPAGVWRPSAPGGARCAPEGAAKPLGGSSLLQQLKLQLLKANLIPGHLHGTGAVRNSTMYGLLAFPENMPGSREGPRLAQGAAAWTQVSQRRSLGTMGECFWEGEHQWDVTRRAAPTSGTGHTKMEHSLFWTCSPTLY